MPATAKAITMLSSMALFAGLVSGLPSRSYGGFQDKGDAAANKGEVLYAQYCRSCHGDEARGDGPAASALKVRPTDLTQIAKKYNGFPVDKVMDSIDGEKYTVGHGSREMPVWGRRFRRSPGGEKGTQSEIALLTKYLESIQQR
jgi:mono/diheme cytochrome c family protein